MTKVVVTSPGGSVHEDVTVLTWRPSLPVTSAPPPKIGLVEISQTLPTELIPGPPGPPGPPGVPGEPGEPGEVPEAPTDGSQYGRVGSTASWTLIAHPDISGKADIAYVDNENDAQDVLIAGKADKTYVDSQDALRVAKAGDTMTGKLVTKASSTTEAGFNIPVGTQPTAPVDGDVWFNSNGLNYKLTGATPLIVVNTAGTQTITGAKTFSINPVMPTPAAGDDSTKGATTAFVKTAISGAAVDISGKADKTYVDAQDAAVIDTLRGGAPSNMDTFAEVSAHFNAYYETFEVDSMLMSKANLASPTFTGDPKAPTPAADDNDTSIATTAFVKAAIAAGGGGGGGASVYVGVSPPPTPTDNQLWWDSDAGRLYIYYTDADTSQWVEAVTSPVDLTGFVKEVQADWQPLLRFSGLGVGMIFANQVGGVSKIGSQVVANFDFQLSAKGTSTGGARITNLPYPIRPGSNVAFAIGYCTAMAAGANQLAGYVSYGTPSELIITKTIVGGTGTANTTDADFTNTSRIIGSISYRTDA